MSDPQTPEEKEAIRIAAWRAERARIAEAEKAERVAQKAAEKEESARAVEAQTEQATQDLLSKAALADRNIGKSANIKRPRFMSRVSLIFRVLIIVILPFVAATYYLFYVSTPLYEAQSVIAISKSDSGGNNSSSGVLGGMQRSANLSEMFRAHAYIRSQALMDALELETGFVTEFSSEALDPISRLRDINFLSISKLMQFDRFVESTVDLQSGLLTLYVRAPTQDHAIKISRAVLNETAVQVNVLGQEIFDQRQAHVSDALKSAQEQLSQAQADLVSLQIEYQEADPRNRVESIYTTIRDLEAQAQELSSTIQTAQISGVGSSPQTVQAIALEARIRERIETERGRLVEPAGDGEVSLNTLLIEFELASLNVGLAQDAVRTALGAQSRVGQEAALNRSLFQIVVPPRTAATPIYPKIPSSLALVLLVSLMILATMSLFRTRTY